MNPKSIFYGVILLIIFGLFSITSFKATLPIVGLPLTLPNPLSLIGNLVIFQFAFLTINISTIVLLLAVVLIAVGVIPDKKK